MRLDQTLDPEKTCLLGGGSGSHHGALTPSVRVGPRAAYGASSSFDGREGGPALYPIPDLGVCKTLRVLHKLWLSAVSVSFRAQHQEIAQATDRTRRGLSSDGSIQSRETLGEFSISHMVEGGDALRRNLEALACIHTAILSGLTTRPRA
jgi:hypothetical protein